MRKTISVGLPVFIVATALLFFILDPGKHIIFPRCVFYSLSGFYCPGCGSQRAIHNLLHLNIAGVVKNNVLFLPAAVVIVYHYVHPVINRRLGLRLPNILYMKHTPWVILGIVSAFWILRNLSSFSFLSPAVHI